MHLGFAVACGVAALAVAFWALAILPEWVRLRKERKAAEMVERAET